MNVRQTLIEQTEICRSERVVEMTSQRCTKSSAVTVLGAVTLLGACVSKTPICVAQTAEGFGMGTRVEIASEIYSDVNIYFAHWRGISDFQQAYKEYVDEITSASDRRSFDLSTLKLFASLSNGHSGFGDRWLREHYGQRLGFSALYLSGQWVVTSSDNSELRSGSVLSKIDGQPFESFYQQQRQYISASDERWRRRALFESPWLFPQSFRVELDDGKLVSVSRREPFRMPGMELDHIQSFRVNGVLVIRIPVFVKPQMEEEAIQTLAGAGPVTAVIVDVRGNHGGSTPTKLITALMDRPYRPWSESTPVRIGIMDVENDPGTRVELRSQGGTVKATEPLYRGPLYILVDGGCFSACEDFVEPFKDNHRAMLIGDTTAGSSGQPFLHSFGNGMTIGISTKHEMMPDGSEFEGVGVNPDVELRISRSDLQQHADPVLEKALQMAHHPSVSEKP